MSRPFFDTLKYARILEQSDFSKTQVDGLMGAQIHVLQSTLNKMVTHGDLRKSEFAMRNDLINTEKRLRTEIMETEKRLETKIMQVEQRLETKIMEVEQRLEAKINRLDLKITEVSCELKTFVLKNTIGTILAFLGLNIALGALLIDYIGR
jgi:hypothetical protein